MHFVVNLYYKFGFIKYNFSKYTVRYKFHIINFYLIKSSHILCYNFYQIQFDMMYYKFIKPNFYQIQFYTKLVINVIK